MANYPTTPLKLSTIDPTLPAPTEDASKIDDALRQTRAIFKGLLALIMDDNGVLLAAPTVADNSVGTTALQDLAVTGAKIAAATIPAGKFVAKAIVGADIANDAAVDANRAIGGDHIKDNAIALRHIPDGTITAAKLAALTITGSQILNDAAVDANRAIGSNHIKNSAVIERCIADGVIGFAKLKTAGASTAGRYLVDIAGAFGLYEVDTTLSQILTTIVGGKLVMSLNAINPNAINTALIKEIGTDGGTLGTHSVGGGAYGTEWIQRPFRATVAQAAGTGAYAVPGTYNHVFVDGDSNLSEIYDPNGLITFVVDSSSGANVTQIKFAQAGKYYVELTAVAWSASPDYPMTHAARLLKVTGGASTVLLETSPRVQLQNQDATVGCGIIDTVSNELVIIQHQCRYQNSVPIASLGTPLGILTNETLCTLFIQKIG
jgi:hypothetical protein